MAQYEDDKFIVIPTKYLKQMAITHRSRIVTLLERMRDMRLKENKDPNVKYFVCNQDEPYAAKVLDVILKGEDAKKLKKAKEKRHG